MVMSLGEVSYSILAVDETKKGLDDASARAEKISKTGLAVGMSMTAVGVGAKLMADNINASYLTFDSAMAEVKSLGGITNEQFEEMRINAIAISKELPLSAASVADGFYMMRSAGFDANKVLAELPAIADMAVAGNLEMGDAVSATTMVLDTYGDTAGSAEDITNVLMGTVAGFKTTLSELQMQLSKNVGVAATLGISFEELAAMSGMLKKDFVSAEEAGTAMKTMLMRLVDPNVTEKLDALGVATTDANGDFIGMQAVLDSLSKELEAAGGDVEQMALLQGIFGTEGVRAAMSLIRQKDELAAYTDQVSSGTAVQEALNAQLESTAVQLEIAKNRTDAAKIAMGEAMAPATILAADAMARLAGVIEDMPEGLQTVIGGGLQFSKVFMGIGPLLMGISAVYPMYTAAQLSAAAAGTTLTASIWASTVAFLASPLGLFIVGIAAVVGVLIILEKKFGVVTKVTEILSDATHRLIGWLKDKLAPGVEFVRAVVARFGDKLLFLLGPIGGVIWGLKKLHGILKDDEEATETATDSWDDLQAKLKDTEGEMGDTAMSLDEITDAMRTLEPEIDEYEMLLGDAEVASKDLAEAQRRVKESAEDVDVLTASYEDLRRAVESLEDLTENQEDQARAIEHAEWGLKDAQDAYNEAVEEHGEHSDDAARANLRLRDAQDRLEDAQERQIDIIAEIAEADTEKQRILSENDVTNLTEFETLLETKRTEYDTALSAEQTAREAHESIMNEIAIREADTQIAEWMRMKEEIETNPVHRKVITEYITEQEKKEIMPAPALTLPWWQSFQHGGIVPGPIGMPMPIIAHGGERFLGARGGGTERPPIEVKIETTIYNYSDVEELERMTAEAVQRGIHDTYGTR